MVTLIHIKQMGAIAEIHIYKMIKPFYKNCIIVHIERTRSDQSFFKTGSFYLLQYAGSNDVFDQTLFQSNN